MKTATAEMIRDELMKFKGTLEPEYDVIYGFMATPHIKGIVIGEKFFRKLRHIVMTSSFLSGFIKVGAMKISMKGSETSWFLSLRPVDKQCPERTLAGLCSEKLLYAIPRDTPENVRAAIRQSSLGSAECALVEYE